MLEELAQSENEDSLNSYKDRVEELFGIRID